MVARPRDETVRERPVRGLAAEFGDEEPLKTVTRRDSDYVTGRCNGPTNLWGRS
jgi:hypothetical protein